VLELGHVGIGGEVGVVEEGEAAGLQQGQDLRHVGLEHRQVGEDQAVERDHEVELLAGDGGE
jgi:hypothetical protein